MKHSSIFISFVLICCISCQNEIAEIKVHYTDSFAVYIQELELEDDEVIIKNKLSLK